MTLFEECDEKSFKNDSTETMRNKYRNI